MNRRNIRWSAGLRTVLTTLSLAALAAPCALAQIVIYHDRATFTAALSGPVLTDTFETYPLGSIPQGDRRGDFLYSFDPNITQPAVAPGGNGGQVLGGFPFDVFGGGDSVTLTFSPLSPLQGPRLRALGADFLYAPSFDTIPADTYRLGIADGAAAGQFAGNLNTLDTAGGTFFLGLISGPATEFHEINLFSVQLDPNFLFPAYQVDNLIYTAVPEPSIAWALPALGVLWILQFKRANSADSRKENVMPRFKYSILAAVGILILAFVLTVIGPKRVMAALGFTPVRDVDNAARQPFQQVLNMVAENTNESDASLPPVPPNKRLVIEFISATFGNGATGSVQLTTGNLDVVPAPPFVTLPVHDGIPLSSSAANQQVRYYCEPGSTVSVRALFTNKLSNISTAHVTIVGYFVSPP